MAPQIIARPLTFPSHRWTALVCTRTGRILALTPSCAPVSAQAMQSASTPPVCMSPRAPNHRAA